MKTTYIPCLDGLRASAFFMVFLGHCGLINPGAGAFGVTVFFFLSGFLITSLLRQEFTVTGNIALNDFYIRRSFRILPPMYIVLAAAYFLSSHGVPSSLGNRAGAISVILYFYNYADLLAHFKFVLPTGMGVLWSLMIEEHFYLVFPVIYRFMMRRRLSNSQQSGIFFSACMLALFWRAYLVFVHGTPITTLPRWTYSATDTRFDSILMGCVLAVRFNPKFADSTPLLTRHKGLLAVGGLILLAFTLVMREPHWRETLRYTVQGVALFPVFFYCVSESSNPIIRLLEMAPIRWLGQVSYAMYLTHALIIRIVESSIVRPSSRFVIALLFTILAGWAVRNLVELPLRTVRDWLLIRVKGVTHGGHPIGFYGHSQGSLTPKVETR